MNMQWGEGGMRVMTEEQIEVLRKQISVYTTICEQLVEMHKSLAQQQDSIVGMRLGNMYCDSLLVPGGHKITARQRWTPTPRQLQILESIFDQGTPSKQTPSKPKIKEITVELSQHGPISETNVYNWFQNRRARSKRKQAAAQPSSTAESEAEADEESPSDKKLKSEHRAFPRSTSPLIVDDLPANITVSSPEMQNFSTEQDQMRGVYTPNDSLRSSGNSGQLFFYDDILSNQRVDQLSDNGSLYHFRHGESFNMIG